jgi:virginiamycin B lyase
MKFCSFGGALTLGLTFGVVLAFAQNSALNRPLPAGDSKAMVEKACSACHPVTMITNSHGHTPQDWTLTVDRMVAFGAQIPEDKMAVVSDYLAKGFPEVDIPKGVTVPGPMKVSFKEWKLQSRGSRPHDPLGTRDGYLWYTGMYTNHLGRIDTKTGEIKEFHPPLTRSGPHGLVEDKDGKIWFTANARSYIGKLDPKTGEFNEYKLPEGARDPHTPIFDPKGILWFTVQNSQKVGRLDPKTGAIKVVDVPTKPSNPYGMVIDSKGAPYYCAFTAPIIARIDPDTMAIKEWKLNNPGARPRRLTITPDDTIYYADFARGYLGRLDLKTGANKEWLSPSGERSEPYGIAYLNGAIWYVESATKPNMLVRFDLKTDKFQSWPIPSGGGVVRNMTTTHDGNLALAESAMNMMGLAIPGK